MLAEEIYSELIELHTFYNRDFKPILAYVESFKGKFPGPILNEIRALNDHVFRTIDPNIQKDIALEEIKKAKRHLIRATLDCFKSLIIAYEEKFKYFEYYYRDVNLAIAKDGMFLPEVESLRNIARNKVFEAKKTESQQFPLKENAYIQYKEAIIAYDNLFKYIDDSSAALANARLFAKKTTRNQKLKNLFYAFAGAVFGLTLTIIYEYFKTKFFS